MIRPEHFGPYRCDCGNPAFLVCICLAHSGPTVALSSLWVCEVHQRKAMDLYFEGERLGYITSLCDPSEAVAELEAIEALVLQEAERVMEGVDGPVRQIEASSENRAERRARSAGRHRQRRSG